VRIDLSGWRLPAIVACVGLVAGLFVVVAPRAADAVPPGGIERVSLPDGVVEGGGQSDDHSWTVTEASSSYELPGGDTVGTLVSGDGNRVVFAGYATNLVAGDDEGSTDVFVRDRAAGTTERVSVGTDGAADDDTSDFPAISRDGRYVAFASLGSLDPADGGGWDVYVRDLDADVTTLVSNQLAPLDTECSPDCMSEMAGAQYSPAISADGRFVAFTSVFGSVDDTQVYVYDRDLDGNGIYDEVDLDPDLDGVRDGVALELVSATWSDAEGFDAGVSSEDPGNGASYDPSISDDGRYIAYTTEASSLTGRSGDCEGSADGSCPDVVVADRTLLDVPGTLPVLVSAGVDGEPAGGESIEASISGDGRLVAFTSEAGDLLPPGEDGNGWRDVFVRDRDGDGDGVLDEAGESTTRRLSVTAGGLEVGGGADQPAISSDGTTVAFHTPEALVAEDVNGGDPDGQICDCFTDDIYLVRLADGHLELVSVADDGSQAMDDGEGEYLNEGPAVSASGRQVAFESRWGYVPSDTNVVDGAPVADVYLRTFDPRLTLTPDPVDHGAVPVGQAGAPRVAMLRNTGFGGIALPATGLLSVEGPGGADFEVLDGTACEGRTLLPLESCGVVLGFTPLAEGPRVASLVVRAPAPVGPAAVLATAGLRGVGLQGALVMTPDPVDFGLVPVGSPSAPAAVTVRNTGAGSVAIPDGGLAVTGSEAPEFGIAGEDCTGRSLLPGQTCSVELRMTPAGGAARTASLVLTSTDSASPDQVGLRGTGVYLPSLVTNPAVGRVGSVTTAIGAGYPAGATVVLSWADGDSYVAHSVTVVADASGSFQAPVLVYGKDRVGPRHLDGASTDGWSAQAVFLAELPTAAPPSFLVRG
jgi:Tol biopolymer transport system component